MHAAKAGICREEQGIIGASTGSNGVETSARGQTRFRSKVRSRLEVYYFVESGEGRLRRK